MKGELYTFTVQHWDGGSELEYYDYQVDAHGPKDARARFARYAKKNPCMKRGYLVVHIRKTKVIK
jgi:hypothetical protein